MATEVYFVILFEKIYFLTNGVFLDDKYEANYLKTDLSEAANKLLYIWIASFLPRLFLCAWPLPWPAHFVTKATAICHFACMKYFWRWLANFRQNYRTNEFLAAICTECNNSRF